MQKTKRAARKPLSFCKTVLLSEHEVQFGEDSLCVFVSGLCFHIPVVNHADDVLRKGVAYAHIPALVAVSKIFGIGGRVNVSARALVIVACVDAVAARGIRFSASAHQPSLPAPS